MQGAHRTLWITILLPAIKAGNIPAIDGKAGL